jgi:hypothetical protein
MHELAAIVASPHDTERLLRGTIAATLAKAHQKEATRNRKLAFL